LFEAKNIDRDTCTRPEIALLPSIRPAPIKPASRRATSLVELMLIVLMLGVFAVIAVPRLDYAIVRRCKAETTARKIVTDLRRVRGLALSNAATHPIGFSLKMDGNAGADFRTQYQIRDLDTSTDLEMHSIDPDVSVWSDKESVRFGPMGNLLEVASGGYPTEIRVSAEGKILTIGFAVATGTITCTEN